VEPDTQDIAIDTPGMGKIAASWRASLAALKQMPPDTPPAAETFPPAGLHFIYRPMLNVSLRRLSAYACLPAIDGADGAPARSGDAVLAAANAARLARLDLLTLREVLANVGPPGPERQDRLLCLPLHLATIAGDEGAAFLGILASLPGAMSSRIVYEVVDIAQGRGDAETAWLVTRLRGYGHGVLGRINPRDPDLRMWKAAGLSCAGIDLDAARLDQADAIKAISILGANARRQGMPVYARGLTTREMALAAIAAGFKLIDGPTVGSDVESPPPDTPEYDMSRLEWG
jgi:hypothetical protein